MLTGTRRYAEMQEPTFDVWSGTPEKNARWLETVAGLANARQRMKELAAQTPGHYFIFSVWNGCILDQIDTQEEPRAAFHTKGGAG